ncbi:MAG: thioredoxin family protein [Methanomicrobiaceae archaeon]|nr:thioredoxin family protein [Methanomicrobiaceae archaeon]
MKRHITRNNRSLKIQSLSLLLVIAAAAVLAAGCTGSSEPENRLSSEVGYTGTNVEKVELYHFYGANRCVSCMMLGDLTEQTVNTYYAQELLSGRLVFNHIDISMPENRGIVERYGPTGSSLWIGIHDEQGFYKEELLGPWYMLGDEGKFSAYIRAVIDQQLA